MSATRNIYRCRLLTVKYCYIYVLLLKSFSCGNAQEECNGHEEGAVRLVGGRNDDEGRLEICVTRGSQGPLWGTVCNDGPTYYDGFDIKAARVVCQQLGVQQTLSEVVTNIYFGGGGSNMSIHLDNVVCNGTEPNLLNCTHNGIGNTNCDHTKDVGIKCKRSQDCTDGDVRLIDENGFVSVVGRVEYCIGGAWGTVCNYEWSEFDAEVVCRQLGLEPVADRQVLSRADVPQVSDIRTPIVLSGLECRRDPSRLDECERLGYVQGCSHSDDAGANCSPEKECNDGDVKLVQFGEYQSENEGRAEFCESGRWGLFCYQTRSGDLWDNDDATVFCRQLGYDVEGRNAQGVRIGVQAGDPPNVLNGVDCKGTERNITECPHDTDDTCVFGGAGVICPAVLNASVCTDGDVRLQGGSLSNKIGRVEVCARSQWGLVCDDEWDDTDATIVCRQLGYTGGMAFNLSVFGTSQGGLYFLDHIDCAGNESSIFDCPHHQGICIHEQEGAGVICGDILGSMERCTEEHTSNKTTSLSGSDATNLTAGRLGTCQRYLRQSDVCNKFYTFTDYIFTTMNQSVLSRELDERVLPILQLSGDDEECNDLIAKVVCHYFFAPCGTNGLPLSVCPEECHYVQSACEKVWTGVIVSLHRAADLSAINCNATDLHLRGLSPCCINASIQIRDDIETTVTSGAEPDNSSSLNPIGPSVGVIGVCMVSLLCIIVASVLF